ncbi:MAG: serine/threonine protein kinase [Deltaproteobacteria bacterium]|nr:serine/threonine protein kinase [Deltaproteobacteria bacterium]
MMETADAPKLERVPVRGLLPGDQAGPWRVEHELGRGGMGAVYAVVHETIGKRAALKVMHENWLDERHADRILLEARVVNQVDHPGIVDIFETGTLPDGRAYIVMERLEGAQLHARAQSCKLLPDTVIEILLQTCDALMAAHAAGIIHRDLKPDNIFLVEHGEEPQTTRVKLLDWGIAKLIVTDVHRTVEGQLVGTPQYLSPEQARGAQVSVKSDVYSLGVMAFELFLEQLPFEAETAAEILAMHLRAAPPLPRDLWPDVPRDLELLLLAMLAKKPEDRPSVSEVMRILGQVRDELSRRMSVHLPRSARVVAAPSVRLGNAPTEQLLSRRLARWPYAVGMFAVITIVCLFAVGQSNYSDADTLPASVIESRALVQQPAVAPSDVRLTVDPAATGVADAGFAATVAVDTLRSKSARKPARTTSSAPRRAAKLDPNGTIDPY